jgi:hypothetical protein
LVNAMSLLLAVAACLWLWMLYRPRRRFRRRPVVFPALAPQRGRKPEWVGEEVLRLRAIMPELGVRKLAHTFNRLHGPAMMVGTSSRPGR